MSIVKGTMRTAYQMTCLDEQIEEDDKARAIDTIVNCLNPVSLGYIEKEKKANSGRPQYDVMCMTKLFLLGYQNGVRSGRKLESACKYDMRFKWIMENRTPDANTINDFRKNNLEYLQNMFYEVNKLYIKLGILKLKNMSQDGFKIKASNSKEKNYTLGKLVDRIKREKKHIELNEQEIKELAEMQNQSKKYLVELEKNEELEDIEERIKEKKRELEEIESRKAKHEELVQRMKNEGVTQISLTDPESKLMKNNGVFEVCYNNQGIVDMETHLTVGFKTDDNPADIGSLEDTAKIIKEKYGEEGIITNVTDKGYWSTRDMMDSLEQGVIPQVTPMKKRTKTVELETVYEEGEISTEEKRSTKGEDIKKCLRSGVIPDCYEGIIEEIRVEEKEVPEEEQVEITETRSSEEIRETAVENQTFERDIKNNITYCPAGEILTQKSINRNKTRYANKLACKNCKNPCTKAKYKTVDFSVGQKTVKPKESEAAKPRGKRKKKVSKKVVKIKLKIKEELISKRMQTSEHSQGTMKTVDNHRYFNMRGKDKVSTEVAIYFTSSNIRRVCNMVGVASLIEKIKGLQAEKA